MTFSAQAAVADQNGSFTLETIEIHPPGPDEVLVAIRASGVCHTDWDSLQWGDRIVLGHEGAGVVETIGENVTHVAIGDRVLLNWAIPCRECFQCELGNESLCERHSPVTGNDPSAGGAQGQPIARSFNLGTLSSHTVVRKEAVIPLTIEIPFSSACILGCGVMTGYGSVVNAAKLIPSSSAVVLGTGGVGLNVIQGARIAGAAQIIAVDISPDRLEMATQFGATHTIQAARDDIGLLAAAEQIKALCHGRGADYAFECTGIPALGAAPLAMIRNAGTAIQVSGIEEVIEIDMNLFEWDKIYLNPLYGKSRPTTDFPRLLELYESGDLQLDELVTRTYALDDLENAFEDMLAGRNAKGVIVFE